MNITSSGDDGQKKMPIKNDKPVTRVARDPGTGDPIRMNAVGPEPPKEVLEPSTTQPQG